MLKTKIKAYFELRRLKNSIKYIRNQIHAYEMLKGHWAYNEAYRREMLNDMYAMKSRYNDKKFKWMRRV